MKLFKRISSVILSLISLTGLGSSSAAINHDIDLTPGQTHTFNHLHTDSYDYSGAYTDTGTFEVTAPNSVSVSIGDNELTSVVEPLSASVFTVIDSNSNVLLSSGDLAGTLIPISALAKGDYTLQFVVSHDGIFGAAYDVAANVVPLPVAAWLFGTALLGFAAFSARRSV
ncbi:MAG: VPLPA-CTERM sorting domain-containing protein [Bacteroidales bacterium]|nr:VPLPA-CTERM sorting domain-containing protein [Bacteroidales bacterium]